MSTDEIKFLLEVSARCKDVDFMHKVLAAAVEGVLQEAKEQREYAVDMETIAAMALNQRLFKGKGDFIAQKLNKNKGRSSICWEKQIDKLESK